MYIFFYLSVYICIYLFSINLSISPWPSVLTVSAAHQFAVNRWNPAYSGPTASPAAVGSGGGGQNAAAAAAKTAAASSMPTPQPVQGII